MFSKTDIKIENIAFGSENKSLTMKHMSESSSSTLMILMLNQNILKKSFFLYKNQNFFKEENIIQKKIRDYISENKILNIDFLKIDTEGYEFNVLRGFENDLSKVSLIMFEHHYHSMIIKKYKFRDINNMLVKIILDNYISLKCHSKNI